MKFLFCAYFFCIINACHSQNLSHQKPAVDSIFTFTEQLPEFPGGDDRLARFIADSLKYPQIGDIDIAGKVILRFVIEKDGSIGDVRVVKKLYPALDAEAVRVVKSLPKFLPAKNHGKPVRCYFNLPLKFEIQ